MTKAEEYLNKAKEKYAEGEQHKNIASRCFESCREYTLEYMIESVNRVLDFIRDEYRAGRICDLETLLCHCQNKLNGNIDGTELDLDGHSAEVDPKERFYADCTTFENVEEYERKAYNKAVDDTIKAIKEEYAFTVLEEEKIDEIAQQLKGAKQNED